MSLYAFNLGQVISTVFGQVYSNGQHDNAANLPEPQSGTNHPKLTTSKNDAFAIVLSAKP
jgi:hypothetical protein